MQNEIYKKLGICIVCKKELAELGRVSCAMCLEKDRARKERLRGQNSTYSEDLNSYKRTKYRERKEQGVCTRCGKRKATNGTRCLDCYCYGKKQRNKTVGLARCERAAYGECYVCGDSVIPGRSVCKKCYDRLLENSEKMNTVWRKNQQKPWSKDNSFVFYDLSKRRDAKRGK